MEIKDNVIKQCLKNVYFITGTPCGGKTTISRALSQKYGFALYDVDEEFSRHQSLSNSVDQPAMNKDFANADEFFLRPYEEYGKWLIDNTREQLDFIITDLISISKDKIVICDLHLTLDEAMELTDPAHIVFLIKKPKNIIDDYCNRPDHDDFNQFINSASNPDLAKANCDKTLESINRERYESIKKSSYFWVERDSNSTIEKTLGMVENYFGFKPSM